MFTDKSNLYHHSRIRLGKPHKRCYNIRGRVTARCSHPVLAAANTGAKDLIPHIQYLIGSENKILDKAARWAVGCLGVVMPSKVIGG